MPNRLYRRLTGCLLSAVAVSFTISPMLNAGIPDRATADRAAAVTAKAKSAKFAFAAATVLPPSSIPYGKTYEEWSALWWQSFLPFTGEQFTNCAIGSSGPVAFLLAGPATCAGSVAADKALFFPVATVECSSLEGNGFFGGTPEQRRQCAASYLPSLFGPGQVLSVEVDDVPLSSYLATSDDFNFVVTGPDNVYGITCGSYPCTGQAGGTGYYVMLAPLSPGLHNIHIQASAFGIDTYYRLSVGSGRESR